MKRWYDPGRDNRDSRDLIRYRKYDGPQKGSRVRILNFKYLINSIVESETQGLTIISELARRGFY